MSSTAKLLREKFGIKSEAELFELINKKEDSFFTQNFFMEKENYIFSLKNIIAAINDDGRVISDMGPAAESGSIIETFASFALSEIRSGYIAKRKTLVHHVSFFKNLKK